MNDLSPQRPPSLLEPHTAAPLGPATEQIVAWFRARGWQVAEYESEGVRFEYVASFGGLLLHPGSAPQVNDRLLPLDCRIVRMPGGLAANLSTCGVIEGCPRHREGDVHDLEPGSPLFLDVLRAQEWRARHMADRDTAFCLLFGPCSLSGSDEKFPHSAGLRVTNGKDLDTRVTS